DRALPRGAPVPRRAPGRAVARALAAYRGPRGRVRGDAPRRAGRRGAERVPREAPRGRPAALSRSVARDHQAHGTRRESGELPRRDGVGHFGLAVSEYTHSTAPNRRYPDLVTQRLVRAALAGAPIPYGRDALGAIAADCTQKEDGAQKVERL